MNEKPFLKRPQSSQRLVFFPHVERVPHQDGLWQTTNSFSPQRESIHHALHKAIQESLTPKQREVIELYFFEGFSQHQIARQLGITQQVVQKRLFGVHRNGKHVGGAVKRLQRALSPQFPQFCPDQKTT